MRPTSATPTPRGFSIDRGVTLSVVSGAILGKTECTTDVQATTVTTSLSAGSERQRRLLKSSELPSRFSDTSVDHESEECDTRLATLERGFPQLQEEFLQIKVTLVKHWKL